LASSAPQKIIIGVSTQDLQNQYWIQLIDSFKKAASGHAEVTVLVGTSNQDPAKQAQDVQNFLSQGAQVIAVSPVNPAAMEPVFDQAMKAGVYVLNDHFPATFGHYNIFLDTGPYNSGYIAGSYAAQLINEQMGGTANCALLTLPENETLTTRVSGITDSLKAIAPNAKVVAEQRAQAPTDAETVVNNILTAHPEVNCLLGWSDTVVLGGIAAIKNRGLDPSKDIIVGIDATGDALAAVKSGVMKGTVNNPPDKFGKLAFDVAYGLITDPTSSWHFITHAITTLELVNQQNVDTFMTK
jgi:ABC-type sugar transport system substrate-binding protein